MDPLDPRNITELALEQERKGMDSPSLDGGPLGKLIHAQDLAVAIQ